MLPLWSGRRSGRVRFSMCCLWCSCYSVHKVCLDGLKEENNETSENRRGVALPRRLVRISVRFSQSRRNDDGSLYPAFCGCCYGMESLFGLYWLYFSGICHLLWHWSICAGAHV